MHGGVAGAGEHVLGVARRGVVGDAFAGQHGAQRRDAGADRQVRCGDAIGGNAWQAVGRGTVSQSRETVSRFGSADDALDFDLGRVPGSKVPGTRLATAPKER